MSFTFPDPTVTPEFTAANGITYSWDATDGKWVVKTTAAIDDIRQDIIELEEKVNELSEIIKGSVARYTLKNTTGTPVSRPGEVSTNTGFYSNVTTFSFGTADADGEPTKTMVNGNIIETYDAVEDKTNRFSITDASGAPTLVSVNYVSGDLFYATGNEIEVNIY